MAITTIPQFMIPALLDVDAASPWGLTNVLLNASGDKCGFAIQCPKDGTLDTFEWLTGTVSNNPDNGIRVSFQDLDGSGLPDGTQDQYRDVTGTISANTWQTTGLMTNDGTDGGTKRTVVAGEWIGVVFEFVSFVASDSINISVLGGNASSRQGSPAYVCDGSTGTYSKSTANYPIGALKYSDGTYAQSVWHGVYPVIGADSTLFSDASTPDEYALRFQFPYKCRVTGFWFSGDPVGDDLTVVLYDGTTALATSTILEDNTASTTSGIRHGFFDNAQELTANTTYRLSYKAGASSSRINRFTLPGSAYLEALSPGVEWYESTRTDAGAWSDSNTTRPWMGLIVDGIEFTAGGGGGGGSFTFIG